MFFPKRRRSNLIKVPSCNIHNEDTCIDDEYVRNLITMAKGANSIAADYYKIKVVKSFERSPALKARIMKDPLYLNYVENNEATRGLTLNVDRERFNKVMKKIAYRHIFISTKRDGKKNCIYQPTSK